MRQATLSSYAKGSMTDCFQYEPAGSMTFSYETLALLMTLREIKEDGVWSSYIGLAPDEICWVCADGVMHAMTKAHFRMKGCHQRHDRAHVYEARRRFVRRRSKRERMMWNSLRIVSYNEFMAKNKVPIGIYGKCRRNTRYRKYRCDCYWCNRVTKANLKYHFNLAEELTLWGDG